MDLQSLVLHPMANGWAYTEMRYNVSDAPALNCKLAQFFEISLYAPEKYDVQIMSVEIQGYGSIAGLQEIGNPRTSANSNQRQAFDVKRVLPGVLLAFVIVILLLCTGVYWCHRRNRGKSSSDVRPKSMIHFVCSCPLLHKDVCCLFSQSI